MNEQPKPDFLTICVGLATLGGTPPRVFVSVPTRLILEPIGGLHYHGSPCNFLNQKTLRLT